MNESSLNENNEIHYGWYIVATGTLCIFACLGLGRFSLGMLLPAMGNALQLSYSQMGFVSTMNFVGYLVAVLLCGRLMALFGARNLITSALFAIGLSMVAIGRTHNLYLLVFLYLLTGMGSALANVPVMALVSIWFTSEKRGKAAGFIVIGSGFAIILSGKLIPYLNHTYEQGWRLGWIFLGILVMFVGVVCYLVIRNRPQERGLQPVGWTDQKTDSQDSFEKPLRLNSRLILHCATIYFLFGFTYVIYATFIVTAMVQEKGFSEEIAGNFWSWVGLLSLLSGPVFGTISDKLGRKTSLMMVFSIQSLAYFLIGMDLPQIFLYLSIGCYGIVAWSIPSIMAALVGDYVGPQRVAAVFGFVTFVFGLGQISGPYLAGQLAEVTDSFSSSFFMAFFMAVFAVVLSALLPGSKKKCSNF